MGNSGSSSRPSPRPNSRYDGHPPTWYQATPPPSMNVYNQETSIPAFASPPPPLSKPQPEPAFRRKYSQKYSRINDNYNSLEEVQRALKQAGLESSNLIVGIDFTKSNIWTGKTSFGGRSLHEIGNKPNPYEKAISIVGGTLTPFDEDNLIPCFGFGDSSTHDKHVFSFFKDNRACEGFEEALMRYRAIVPYVKLAGPTSFAPIVNAAVDIVEQSGGQYHVLIIIADGQVTRSVDTDEGQLSPQERESTDAIVNASAYPLSIVLVGVGDGPWDMMRAFDDNLPARSFDNFQFVNFTEIMARHVPQHQKEAQFALAALMEIPQQYKATLELGILGQTRGSMPGNKPLPPPPGVLQADATLAPQMRPAAAGFGFSQSPSFGPQVPEYSQQRPNGQQPFYQPSVSSTYYSDYGHNYPPSAPAASPSAPSYAADRSLPAQDTEDLECPVCRTDKKDMAFNCGHTTCRQCSESLTNCPLCRKPITTRIRLY